VIETEKRGAMIKHKGGCHCGNIRYEISAPATLEVLQCNCSMCSKAAYLHLIIPNKQFSLLQGSENLIEYTFNTGTAKHLFCSKCGIKSFYIPRSHPNGISVNARCIEPETIAEMKITEFNGMDWEKAANQL
jgi:hypothetical protein